MINYKRNWISQVCLVMCWTQMARRPARFIQVNCPPVWQKLSPKVNGQFIFIYIYILSIPYWVMIFLFSLNQPTEPIQPLSRNVRESCVMCCVCHQMQLFLRSTSVGQFLWEWCLWSPPHSCISSCSVLTMNISWKRHIYHLRTFAKMLKRKKSTQKAKILCTPQEHQKEHT